MQIDNQTILVRAMNSTRPSYFPAYAGLRALAATLPKTQNDYLKRLIVRRLSAVEPWRWRRFPLYKGSTISEIGTTHEYRECLAPSPTTAAAEALVLAYLATHAEFATPDRAYSYRWPKSTRTGRTYEYFAVGYHERNMAIAAALNNDNLAVVTDIRRFYPSVKRNVVEGELRARLSRGQHDSPSDAIFGFFSGLFDAGQDGIPIGPASGHLLGHLALTAVDRELSARYGQAYFRYVDDIVVVCRKDDAIEVERHIHAVLNASEFQANPEKTQRLSKSEWVQIYTHPDTNSEDGFRAFANDVALWLTFHPESVSELKQKFIDARVAVPVSRLHALSKYPRYRYFLSSWKSGTALRHYASIWMTSTSDLVERAIKLKSTYENTLAQIIGEVELESPATRRWQLQRVRRIINALFYLRSFDEWTDSVGAFSRFPELLEQKALAESLSSGNVAPILPFYGRGPAAFAELWSEYGTGPLDIPDHLVVTDAVREGLVTLSLFGILGDSPNIGTDPRFDRLNQFASSSDSSTRKINDLSFDDEMISLRSALEPAELNALCKTRYSSLENSPLEALNLLVGHYLI